jgi:hypothetical protein
MNYLLSASELVYSAPLGFDVIEFAPTGVFVVCYVVICVLFIVVVGGRRGVGSEIERVRKVWRMK